jgi:predicted nucleotidyltransferase
MSEQLKHGIERSVETFKDGLAMPKDPSQFLMRLLNHTPDYQYSLEQEAQDSQEEDPETLKAQLPERRTLVKSTMESIVDISRDIAVLYRTVANESGFSPEHIRVYVVGGRIRQTPLRHSSDIDIIISTDDQAQSLQPNYLRDAKDLVIRKRESRKIFIDRMNDLLHIRGLLEKPENGREGWFIEPKSYGIEDATFRRDLKEGSEKEGSNGQLAVLVYED